MLGDYRLEQPTEGVHMSLGDNFPPLESSAAGGIGLCNRNVTDHQDNISEC